MISGTVSLGSITNYQKEGIQQKEYNRRSTTERSDSCTISLPALRKIRVSLLARATESNECGYPPLKLPRFFGEENDRECFRDMFIAITKRDESLSDVKKQDLLKCSLEGKAKKALVRLPTKGTTFNIAWSILLKRYNHPRLLVTQHLNALMTLPILNKEDSNDLQNLMHTVEINQVAVRECGRPAE